MMCPDCLGSKRSIILLLLLFVFTGCSAARFSYKVTLADTSDTFVIVLHGLRGGSNDFEKLEKALLSEGYSVCCIGYPSTDYTIQALADTAIHEAISRCEQSGSSTINFVAHSMGSILVRYYLQENDLPQLGRVVFISPPNQGTELIDKFDWSKLFQKFNGPGGMQLSADEDGFIRSLELPDYEFGVIMSTRSINPIESAFITGKDDGRVAIESAKLDGMSDFVLVESNHHVSMKKESTIKHVINFLKNGEFDKELNME